jgi:serine phosphatase RsbU (regulator of sigma subunit)
MLLIDGITELVNHADEECGLARLEQLLRKNAAQPQSQIWEVVMVEVWQHGAQKDDQNLMLLRVCQ